MLAARPLAADDQRDRGGRPGQVHRGLAGGVPAADDEHGRVRRPTRRTRRRRSRHPRRAAPASDGAARRVPGDAGRNHDRPRLDPRRRLRARRRCTVAPGCKADPGLREHEAGAEEPGLLEGAVGEVAAGEPVREAEVVADPGAGAGLAAGTDGLDHRGLEPLRGGVDGRGEPGRPGADDDDVAATRLGLGREPERGREPLVRGVDERRRRSGTRAPAGRPPSRPSSAEQRRRPSSEPGGEKPKGTPIREKMSRRRWARASNSSPTILAASNCGGCDASQSARNSATGRYSQRSRGPQGMKT